MDKKLIALVIVAVLVASFAGSLLGAKVQQSLGAEGDTNYTNVVASGYITAGSYMTATTELNVAGIRNSSGTVIGSGTTIAKYNCVSATVNFPSVASSGNAFSANRENATSVAFNGGGFVVGKPTIASLTSDTSTVAHQIFADVYSTASSSLWLVNLDGSALDLATGTASVCQIQ